MFKTLLPLQTQANKISSFRELGIQMDSFLFANILKFKIFVQMLYLFDK